MKKVSQLPRTAIYARYSSDIQNPKSIDDQIRLCKKLALERFGITSFSTFSDIEISGETLLDDRSGLQELMGQISIGLFDLVIAEGLDRLSRNTSHTAKFYDFCEYHMVKIFTNHEGEVGVIHVGVIGAMNQLSNKNMRDRVRRAHSARAAEGRVPAGLAYGYRVIRGKYDDRGRPINGLREIDDEQAAVVRRIYTEYSEGKAVKSIVRGLNNDEIPSPSGRKWSFSSLLCSQKRQRGILYNEIYHGWLVFNKMSTARNPVTGRLRFRSNPESEWVRHFVPELQIIDDDLWSITRDRIVSRPLRSAIPRKKRLKHYETLVEHTRARPLTRLIVCGRCNGRKTIANDHRYLCSTNRYLKKCSNARGTREQEVLFALSACLRREITSHVDWHRDFADYFADRLRSQESASKKIEQLEQKIDRLVEAIDRGVSVDSATEKVIIYQNQLVKLKGSQKQNISILTHEDTALSLLAAVHKLEKQFFDDKMTEPIRQLLVTIVDQITLTPIENRRRGENISITLKPRGWPKFYEQARSIWPD